MWLLWFNWHKNVDNIDNPKLFLQILFGLSALFGVVANLLIFGINGLTEFNAPTLITIINTIIFIGTCFLNEN